VQDYSTKPKQFKNLCQGNVVGDVWYADSFKHQNAETKKERPKYPVKY
jgi:hypothetical protein